ncbi:MAG: cation diffusion facilitator family transporter [Dehalococcoidales bacterium]|nr:cation diffusion facilitator family transporter [Dehalococcoidales bacterium]
MTDHNHNGGTQAKRQNRGLLIALAIVIVMMVAEIIGGLVSHSLALLSDAGHMMVDGLALTISIFALNLAQRPANTKRTFGYHRVEIMAALANGVILTLVSVFIFYEAYQRLRNPPEVRSGLMLTIAILGLAANLVGIWLLHRDREANLNIRGAFLHILGDTISSVGVIAGAIIIGITGKGITDPIIAIIIGGIILWGAFRLVKESADILMEAVPGHIQLDKVTAAIQGIPGVQSAHDLHIWTITSGIFALSSHIVVDDVLVSRSGEIVKDVNSLLEKQFNITHTTLQLECLKGGAVCESLVCEMRRPGENEKEH